MHALLLAVALAITPPAPSTQAERLATYITTVYHGADSYAEELAERMNNIVNTIEHITCCVYVCSFIE